ncbi:hypothetical protein FKM82_030397 [Ascaphus truei]
MSVLFPRTNADPQHLLDPHRGVIGSSGLHHLIPHRPHHNSLHVQKQRWSERGEGGRAIDGEIRERERERREG